MCRTVLLLLLLATVASDVFADGLIWQLPPDGTIVEFQGESQAEVTPVLAKEFAGKLPSEAIESLERAQKVNMPITVVVSSVGEVKRAEQNCRWIELKMQSSGQENILKVLVPEKCLARGEDPLDHAILTFFNAKDVDQAKVSLEKGFNRIAYEIDRFRTVFPTQLRDVQELPRKTIETPLGTFADCEVIAGTTEFDRPLLGKGRWEFKGSWQFTLHPDAPFGVVEVQCHATAHEYTHNVRADASMISTLTISKAGRDAKSALSDD